MHGKCRCLWKTAETANLQDELTGALIGLASACTTNPKTEQTDRLLIEGLFTTVTNVNFNDETLREMIRRVREEKERVLRAALPARRAAAVRMIMI